ncbi:MAG: serine/threonine protein kinase [Candidatus Nealsonbacteria bacterium]|nr:serine/threonine protein kinase [Candidatus Nealsonbacteria bacterium]
MNGLPIIDELQATVTYRPAVGPCDTYRGVTETASPPSAGTGCNCGGEAGRNRNRIGQYLLKGKLGAGGMGEVYEAEHRMLGRRCAIKFVRPEDHADPSALARFEQEVQATARLTHWNTVDVFDYGHTDDGTFYYVMELLPGMSLAELVDEHGPLPAARAVHLLRQVCRALREAHAMGLIHRDIKPGNIFAATRGGLHDVAKLLDFGLVKCSRSEASEASPGDTAHGFSGSPLFMSPEQAADYDAVDARSDVYSLGAVAYYLLTGRPPFSGRNAMALVRAHCRDAVVPPSSFRPDVPADLQRVVLRCLEKDPDDRFPDVESLERALAECEAADGWSEQQAADWWAGR